MKKRKLTPKQKQLQADWEAMVARHQSPLEKGAVAKAAAPTVKKVPSKMPALIVPEERSSRSIASMDTGKGSATKPNPMQYTGDKVIGIAVLHKSCLQPIFNEEAAVDVAKMRR